MKNTSKGDITMNLKPIASNMTEVELGQITVLFSYETPVAYRVKATNEYYKTNKYWSRTTSKHINKWIPDSGEVMIRETDQEDLDNLLNEVK
jgi:hypothetical protein